MGLTTSENTVTYHNSLCLSPQTLHKHCFQFLLGPVLTPKRNWGRCLRKSLGWQTKSSIRMVCYGIFWSGQLIRLISLMNSFAASVYGRRICLLEFAIVLKLKNNNKNFSEDMLRLQMNQPWKCGLINPRNSDSYLAFSFLHFSKTTLLQLGVFNIW